MTLFDAPKPKVPVSKCADSETTYQPKPNQKYLCTESRGRFRKNRKYTIIEIRKDGKVFWNNAAATDGVSGCLEKIKS